MLFQPGCPRIEDEDVHPRLRQRLRAEASCRPGADGDCIMVIEHVRADSMTPTVLRQALEFGKIVESAPFRPGLSARSWNGGLRPCQISVLINLIACAHYSVRPVLVPACAGRAPTSRLVEQESLLPADTSTVQSG